MPRFTPELTSHFTIHQMNTTSVMNIALENSSGKNRGFTLIEILVTMAILGILAGIVIPLAILFMGSGSEEAFLTEKQNMQTAVIASMALMRTDIVKGDFIDDGNWHNDFSDPDSVYVEGEDGSILTLRDVVAPGHLETAYWYQISSNGKIIGTRTDPY